MSLEAQAALYRSLLAGRRVLVLLDNAADEDQVRPLLPGSPGCLVIVTSRNELPGLIVTEGAHPVDLDLMSVAEARAAAFPPDRPNRVAAETQAVDGIIALCARLPLALMLVAARAATTRVPPFRARRRAARGRRLAGPLGGQTRPPTCGRSSPGPTSGSCAAAARLFRLLGLHFGPDIKLASDSQHGRGRREARSAFAGRAGPGASGHRAGAGPVHLCTTCCVPTPPGWPPPTTPMRTVSRRGAGSLITTCTPPTGLTSCSSGTRTRRSRRPAWPRG